MKNPSMFQGGCRGLIIILALGLSPIVPASFAQELLPELAGPAARQKAAYEALYKQKRESVALATKPYLSALDSLEKTATAKGELKLVAAINNEREAALAGTLGPELPAALPKMNLLGTRKALMTKLEQLNADFARRRKQTDADYLRFLATLQTKASSNPELAKQLAAEKSALLEDGCSALTECGKSSKKANSKNVVVNGDFEKLAEGKPEGWQNSQTVTVETEKGNKFVRFDVKTAYRDGTADSLSINQTIESPIPAKAERITMTVRIRTQNVTVIPAKANWPVLYARICDDNNKEIKLFQVQGRTVKNGVWKEFVSEQAIPIDSLKLHIRISTGGCPGQFDFDDVVVTFK